MAWRIPARLSALLFLCITAGSASSEDSGSFGTRTPIDVAQSEGTPPASQQPPAGSGSSTGAAPNAATGSAQEEPQASGRELETITVRPSQTAARKSTKPRKAKTTAGASPARGDASPAPGGAASISGGVSLALPGGALGPVDGYAATNSATGTKTGTPLR
jgi:hypothetical protein